MKRCPECSEKVRHYSSRNLYDGRQKRYYKCSCGVSFTTCYRSVEVIVKVRRKEGK